MLTIYEHPGGIARYFVHDDGVNVSSYASFLPAFYINERTFFTMDGKPAYWLNEEGYDNALHPFDADKPVKFYFDASSERELQRIRDPNAVEDNEPFGSKPSDLSTLAAIKGRRAAFPSGLPPVTYPPLRPPVRKPSRVRARIGI